MAYLDEDWSPKSSTYGGSGGAASSLDALAAVGAATTAAAEEQNVRCRQEEASAGRKSKLIPLQCSTPPALLRGRHVGVFTSPML